MLARSSSSGVHTCADYSTPCDTKLTCTQHACPAARPGGFWASLIAIDAGYLSPSYYISHYFYYFLLLLLLYLYSPHPNRSPIARFLISLSAPPSSSFLAACSLLLDVLDVMRPLSLLSVAFPSRARARAILLPLIHTHALALLPPSRSTHGRAPT